VLVVDEAYGFAGAMTAAKPKGFELVHATSGGEGLDRISSGTFHYATTSCAATSSFARRSSTRSTKVPG
jgi:hypothetical protein